ncbi:MAG: TIGR00282 family metallophosphoesterase [SAR202 cluster bacterium]|nr:TIGR00282 family metallophosphoesterase [SAR202 cluster bacterium]
MRILMIGDVVGRPGRRAVKSVLPSLKEELAIDFVTANGENSAGGFGVTLETAKELFSAGVDVITSGNHIWDQRDIYPHLKTNLPVLRPLNYPPSAIGRGHALVKDVMVINLLGRVFVGTVECPFRAVDALLTGLKDRPRAIVVDFHAEASSEKMALGWYLDGRVSAVAGTHTHVPTADARILPKGTGFVHDLGMAGTLNSVIGFRTEDALVRFLDQTPHKLNVEDRGPLRFNSVLFEVDETTGKATSVRRTDRDVL